MKTNPAARRLIKVRLILTCLAIFCVAVVEFGTGRSLATRVGQTTPCQTEPPQPLNLSLDTLMAATR